MKKISILGFFLLFSGAIAAQQPQPSPISEKPKLPKAPILHRAPPLAKWMISFGEIPPVRTTPPASASPGETELEVGQEKKKNPRNIIVVKSGKLFFEVEVDEEGQRLEKWHLNGTQVSVLPGSNKWILTDGGVQGVFYTNYVQHDFPDFDWISPKNYISFGKIGAFDCYIFHDRITLPETPESLDATAAVDSITQLPVYLEIGGVKRSYKFLPPPNASLSIPQNIQDIFEQQQKSLAPLLRRPGKS